MNNDVPAYEQPDSPRKKKPIGVTAKAMRRQSVRETSLIVLDLAQAMLVGWLISVLITSSSLEKSGATDAGTGALVVFVVFGPVVVILSVVILVLLAGYFLQYKPRTMPKIVLCLVSFLAVIPGIYIMLSVTGI